MNVMKRILAVTLTVMSISSYAGGRGCARCHGGACSRKSAPSARPSCSNGVCRRQPAPQAQSGFSDEGGFRSAYFAAKKAVAEAKQKAAQATATLKRQEEQEAADLAKAMKKSLEDAPVAPQAHVTRTVLINEGVSTSAQSGSDSERDSVSRLSDGSDSESKLLGQTIELSKQQPEPIIATKAAIVTEDAIAPNAPQGLLASSTRIFTSQQKPVTPAAPAETPAAAPQAQAPVETAAVAAPAPEKPADMLNTLPSITDPVVQTLNADAAEASKILNFFTCDQDKLVFVKWFNAAIKTKNYNGLHALINTLMTGDKEGFKTAVRNIMALQQDTVIAEDQLIDYVFELIQSNTNNQAICNLITVVYNMDHNFLWNKGLWASLFDKPSLSGLLTKLVKTLDLDGTDITEEQKSAWKNLSPLHKLYYIEFLATYCTVMNKLSEVTTTK